MQHIWSAFIALTNSRTFDASGPSPISYQEIKAWKELTHSNLSPRDVEAIKRLDLVYMRVMNG